MTVARNGFSAVALALITTLLWVAGWYWHTGREVVEIWWRSETFAHGLIILPAFAWLVWRSRSRIGGLQPQPVGWMALPVLAAGTLWLLGGMVSVAAAQHFAFFVMLVSAFVGVLGWRLSRVLLFPLAFLFFGVPIGEFMLPTLMHYTAEFTVWALRLSGVPVYQEGLHFIVPNGRWSVVEACSGIRYLIASLVVGALYAYLNYSSLKRRVLFMVVALVVPVLANWLRAYLIVMLGYLSDNKIAAGVDHILYGWVFFGVVIFLVFWIGSRWHEDPVPMPANDRFPSQEPKGRTNWLGLVPVAAAVALFPPLLKWLDAPMPDFPVTLKVPSPAFGWSASAETAFDYRAVYAGARAEATQTYVANEDSGVVVFHAAWYVWQREGREMIAWGNGPASTAQQHVSQVRSPRTVSVDGRALGEHLIDTPSGRVLVWHWYRVNGRDLVRDLDVKLRLALDRLRGEPDESAVILVATALRPDEEDAARERLRAFVSSHSDDIETMLQQAARSMPK